jgi:hypothetical protein
MTFWLRRFSGSRFWVPFFALRATQGRQGSGFKGYSNSTHYGWQASIRLFRVSISIKRAAFQAGGDADPPMADLQLSALSPPKSRRIYDFQLRPLCFHLFAPFSFALPFFSPHGFPAPKSL